MITDRNIGPTIRRAMGYVLEAALLFGAAWMFKQFFWNVPAGVNIYWAPIIILATQHGVTAGIMGAIIASILLYSTGLPAQDIEQGLYEYRALILTKPALWLFGGALLGAFRARHENNEKELAAALDTTRQQATILADAVDNLQRRATGLERRIAADDNAVGALLNVLPSLSEQARREVLAVAAPYLPENIRTLEHDKDTDIVGLLQSMGEGVELAVTDVDFQQTGAAITASEDDQASDTAFDVVSTSRKAG